jgi:phospholipase D
VQVRVLLDGGNLSDNQSVAIDLKSYGIDVRLDKMPGIAHNKIIIIDNEKVITGSFNFTMAADHRNAENVILIEDANIASVYLRNWHKREKESAR